MREKRKKAQDPPSNDEGGAPSGFFDLRVGVRAASQLRANMRKITQRRRVNRGARRRGHGVPCPHDGQDGREKVGRNELRPYKGSGNTRTVRAGWGWGKCGLDSGAWQVSFD